jgi:hypothetical protein
LTDPPAPAATDNVNALTPGRSVTVCGVPATSARGGSAMKPDAVADEVRTRTRAPAVERSAGRYAVPRSVPRRVPMGHAGVPVTGAVTSTVVPDEDEDDAPPPTTTAPASAADPAAPAATEKYRDPLPPWDQVAPMASDAPDRATGITSLASTVIVTATAAVNGCSASRGETRTW